MKSAGRYILALVAFAALAAGVATAILRFSGGVSPKYAASDKDPFLTAVAKGAAPLIRAIDRFYAAHGKCPQAQADAVAELRVGLDRAIEPTIRGDAIEFRLGRAVTGWTYYSSSQNPTLCTLSTKLGLDPRLIWQRDGGEIQWIFDPGDGSATKSIALDE